MNFLVGAKEHWRSRVPTWRKLVYRGVWPGIDLEYLGYQDRLEYRLLLAAGADPAAVIMETGARKLSLDEHGNLLAEAGDSFLRMSAPYAYQEIVGRKVPVAARFLPLEDGAYTFHLGNYDTNHPLIIDPVLEWGTFLGGSGFEFAYDVAVDSSGRPVIVGETVSTDFPTTSGVFDEAASDAGNVFITKLTADGSGLVFSTYLGGGSAIERGQGVALDSSDRIIVTGRTESGDFPTTPGVFDRVHNGANDVFVASLSADGTSLDWSTFMGSSGDDQGTGVTVDPAGNVYVCGFTADPTFPITPGAFDESQNGSQDAFVAKLTQTGNLVYATFMGGSGGDQATGIDVNAIGEAHVTGYGSNSGVDFPTTSGAFDETQNGNVNTFVSVVSTDGSSLVWSTFLGGSTDDRGKDIAIDPAGDVFVTGTASSSDFPTTAGAIDETLNGMLDIFLTRLSADGTSLIWSSYLGGANHDSPHGIALDSMGNVVLTGETQSPDLPTTGDALSQTLGGVTSAFFAGITADGATLTYASYLGGSGADSGSAVALDASNRAYITGSTTSSDFPTTPGVFNETTNGSNDAFVVSLVALGDLPVTDNGDGTYTAEYTPEALGMDQLEISINGQANRAFRVAGNCS